MADLPLLNNALGWAHFQLQGGGKKIALYGLGYIVAITALLLISIRLNPLSVTSKTIRKDITSGIIESHRLMPISGSQAVVGYIAGSIALPVSLSMITFFIGVITCTVAGVPLQNWLFANVILGVFTLFAWTISAFAAFAAKSGTGYLAVMIILIMASNGIIVLLLPGLLLIISPAAGPTVFGLLNMTGIKGQWQYGLSFVFQLLLILLFFAGATRRYRRDDVQGFTPIMSIILVMVWIVISTITIHYWRDFRPNLWKYISMEREYQITASLAATLLLGLIPIASAARVQAERWRKWLIEDPGPRPRWTSSFMIVLVITFVTLLIPYQLPHVTNDQLLRTAVIMAAFLAATSFLLRILYRATINIKYSLMIWVLFYWGAPFIFAGLSQVPSAESYSPILAMLSTCSPLGLLLIIWNDWPVNTNVGISVQCVVAILAAILYYGSQKIIEKQVKTKYGS